MSICNIDLILGRFMLTVYNIRDVTMGDRCNCGLTQIFRYLNPIAPNQGEQSQPTIAEVAANIFLWLRPCMP